MKIRYSEAFCSIQGEAAFTGMPSVWVRLFGCNLQCNGLGQDNPADPSTWELPYQTIDLSQIKYMEDLPVLNKGCDSGYSWSARFKHLAYDTNEVEMAEKINRMAKERLGVNNDFKHPVTKRNAQLCFTGGEPMMQQKAIVAICKELAKRSPTGTIPQITIETNGTKPLEELFFTLRDYVKHIHFAISPKLKTVSGEVDVVKRNIIESYASVADSTAVKFVVNGTPECWHELEGHEFWLRDLQRTTLWCMPVGATKEQQSDESISRLVYEIALRGYQVAARVHTYLFSNKMGT